MKIVKYLYYVWNFCKIEVNKGENRNHKNMIQLNRFNLDTKGLKGTDIQDSISIGILFRGVPNLLPSYRS